MITIKLPLPDYFTYKEINIYLIKEEPVTLIDTGPFSKNILYLLENKLKDYKINFSDIKRIFLTHGHVDHTGLAGFFEKNYNSKIFIHSRDYNKVTWENKEKIKFKNKTLGKLLLKYGFDNKLIDDLNIFFNDFYQFNIPLAAPVKLSKEETFECEKSKIKTINLHGHTSGSIGFLIDDLHFITGDTILNSTFVTPILEFNENMKSYKNLKNYYLTLKKLLNFKNCKIYPGHGDGNFNFSAKAIKIIDYIEKKADEVKNKIDFSKSFKENFEILFNTTPEKFFFHFSFFYGILEFLELEDKLQ